MASNTFHKYAAEVRKLTCDFSYATNNAALHVLDPLLVPQLTGFPQVTITLGAGTPSTNILNYVSGSSENDENLVTLELEHGEASPDSATTYSYYVMVAAQTTQGQELIMVTKVIMRQDNEV